MGAFRCKLEYFYWDSIFVSWRLNMNHNRFALVLSVFLLVSALPAPVLAAAGPSLPHQAAPPIETISAGSSFSCWIQTDSTVACWGANESGQSTPPAGTFTQISAGVSGNICGLRSDGTIACWPDGGTPPPAGTFTQVSPGGFHSCALQGDGSLTCWGSNGNGESTPPAGTFTQVSAGLDYTCAVQSDSTVACWGTNVSGQSTPPAGSFTQVNAGDYHTCGLQSDGAVACWGHNFSGESTPPAGTFTQVSVGGDYSCGLKSDATIACWGNNDYGQSTPPTGTFTQVSSGYSHSCALRSNGIPVCWGRDDDGELDPIIISGHTPIAFTTLSYTDGTPKSKNADFNGDYSIGVSYNWSGVITPSSDEGSFSPISRSYTNLTVNQAGQDYVRAVIISGFAGAAGATLSYTDGTPKTATADSNGNYSIAVSYNWSGTVTPSLAGFVFKPANQTYTNLLTNQPYQNYIATSGVAFAQVSAGYHHSCMLKSNGSLSCWGNDDSGEANPPMGTFLQVSAGEDFTCALRTNKTLACWGASFYHQTTPPVGTFTQVSAGEFHACALRVNGTAICWGDNDDHQVSPIPSGTFTRISAGERSTCGMRSNGSLTCWGAMYNKPAGTFTDFAIRSSGCAIKQDKTLICWPQYAIDPPDGTFTQVSVGSGIACGLKSNSAVTCWGPDYHIYPPAGAFTQVSVGSLHACGLKRDNSVVCWGSNAYAQLEPSKLSFQSDSGALDGFILESSETSGIGGSLDSLGRYLILGDDSANCQYRAVLSFRTQFLPDSYIIKSAVVKIMKASINGSNPFSALGNLLIDIRKGPFGGNSALQTSDFNAPSSALKVGTFNTIPVANWYTATLSALGRNQINKIGLTQLRLYFGKDDNNNHVADYIRFLSGNALSNSGSGDVKPILIIEYTLP
jgi:alpha-tubulin suppressor-like RCC1 family protein